MSESNEKRPSINLASLFITFPDSLSPKSPLDVKKSPRNFDGGGVGLGIVAAMNEINDTHDAFSAAISSRTAKTAFSPRSVPIPIVSGKINAKFRGPMSQKEELELSESYTCVISHIGNQKHEYFEMPGGMCGNGLGKSGGLCAFPPTHVDGAMAVPVADFLNSCYLCRKKLQGLDIFMYSGDQAFCSAECRRQQILNDEHREKCGYEALKSLDYSSSPCSAPRIFSAGVAAA